MVAITFDAVKQPSFLISTARSLHSFGSMMPFPLPPEIVAELKMAFAVPLKHVLSVVVPPFVIITVNGPPGSQS